MDILKRFEIINVPTHISKWTTASDACTLGALYHFNIGTIYKSIFRMSELFCNISQKRYY